jgi:two-component system, OmpR family, KDP operon response regulator KdpE
MTRAMHQILVIEDEPQIRAVLKTLLEAEAYRIIEADTVQRGEQEARTHRPDLLVVDLGLPDGSGLAVIQRVRQWSPVPIIVLSARTQEEEKVKALDAGADDYVTKPFAAAELLARVRAALRRTVRAGEHIAELVLGERRIDFGRRQSAGPAGEIHLTPMEYRVLEILTRHLGSVVTQNQLVREAWGPSRVGDSRSLRVCIKNLREKLEPEPSTPRYLLTETGLGYRLRGEDDIAALSPSSPGRIS